VQQRDGLTATTPLDTVAWHDVYAPFLKWAAASGRAFYPFAYDWRRDNLETTESFIKFLDKVCRESGGVKVQVVAHSMGGLITFAAVHRHPELFHSVLFAGVPFGPSISFLEDMHAGTANGFNSRILSPQVLFTFPSIYTLFPADPKESGLVEADGSRIVHDWFSAEDWERQRLGIFSNSSPTVTQEQRDYLRKALEHARHFKIELALRGSFAYPPIAVLAGDMNPTLSTVLHNGPRSVKGWDFVTAAKNPGDNRVEFTKAVPPAGIRYSVFKSTHLHEDLLSDTKQVESILARFTGAGGDKI
jgi:pimeloyl-ACP methyl ester carboxylesterase